MSNGQLSQKEQEALAKFLGILGLILTVIVAIILIARVVFWISVFSFVSSIIYLIIGIFIDFDRTQIEDYFDGFPHSLFAVFLIVLFWCSAHFAFPIGYSELSYNLIDLNEEYKETMNLPYQITMEALNDTCSNMPTKDYCGNIIDNYQMANELEGISDTAKTIQWIFNIKF